MHLESALKNLVRVGTVSSVDVEERLVRVEFHDKLDADGNTLISGTLKVLQNQPLITTEEWVEELGAENKWDFEAEYNSHDRNLGLGESYVQKSYADMKDVFTNQKTVKYEKRETIAENGPMTGEIDGACTMGGTVEGTATIRSCPFHGIIEHKKHKRTVTVYPWLPFVGQLVVCLYIPNGESDGFVLGGI